LEKYERIKQKLKATNEHLLAAFATGDRRLEATLKKSFPSESAGFLAFNELKTFVKKEASREKLPKKSHPKQKLKKELRRYRIQNKVRFTKPFFRFWYRFLYPNEELIYEKRYDELLSIVLDDLENFVSLTFEELSNEMLKERFKEYISSGSYWDRKVELDIYLELANGQKVVGECKWKNSRICKKTLTSLQKKAKIAGISADYFALFSKSGFSNELLKNRPPNILLFDLEDFKEWSGQKAYKKSQKKPYSYEF
jgi:hypothetical protein